MQLIGHGDWVVRTFFVFLSVMLVASVYLFLIKFVDLSCRAWYAKRFLRRFSQARSLQQVRALVDGQPTIKSFSQVAHRILVEIKGLGATTDRHAQASGVRGAAAQRLIAHEAAAQASELRRGMSILAAVAWVAPVTGLVATLWREIWAWLQSAQAGWAGSALWGEELVMMRLGLAVAIIALAAYLCLRVAHRMYLSQFTLFGQIVMPLLEPDRDVPVRGARPRHDFPQAWTSVLNCEV